MAMSAHIREPQRHPAGTGNAFDINLPKDVTCEARMVTGLLLVLDRRCWLGQLQASDFFCPFYQQLFEEMRDMPADADLVNHLCANVTLPGTTTAAAIAQVVMFDGEYPGVATPRRLQQHVQRLKVVGVHRRRIIAAVEELRRVILDPTDDLT